MSTNITTSPFLLRQDELSFTLDYDGIEKYSREYYSTLEFTLRVDMPFDQASFTAYLCELIHTRIKQISGERVNTLDLRDFFMPSFLESVLSYINSNLDVDSGFNYTWIDDHEEFMTLDTMKVISRKMAMLSKSFNDIVKGYPKAQTPSTDCLYIRDNSDFICAYSSVSPREVGIAAMLGQRLHQSSVQFDVCFRKQLTRRVNAIDEVLNGTI